MTPEVNIRSQPWAKDNSAFILADCAVEDGVHVNCICNTVIDTKLCGL